MSVPPVVLAAGPLPPLPHWESAPADLPGAIRQVKAAIRARIAASGRTVEDVFSVVEQRVSAEVDEILAARHRGEAIWPVIDYADIESGDVPAGTLAKLRRRGCLVVRGHFDRGQALAWDRDMVDYVESNAFFENYRGPGDDFFAAWAPGRRSTRSTGPPLRCRPARATGWPRCRRSSTASGSTTPRVRRGSNRAATRCTRTASGGGRRAPIPADSGPISTPAPSNCG